MSEPTGVYDITDTDAALAQAQAVLKADAARRAEACRAVIQEALDEYRCTIVARITDANGRVIELPAAVFAL